MQPPDRKGIAVMAALVDVKIAFLWLGIIHLLAAFVLLAAHEFGFSYWIVGAVVPIALWRWLVFAYAHARLRQFEEAASAPVGRPETTARSEP